MAFPFRFSPASFRGVIAEKVGSLFGKGVGDEKDDNPQLDVDKNGEPLYKSDIIARLYEDLEKRREARHSYELQWILNSNFLVGNQFCDINPSSGDVEQQETPYDWLEMRAFNLISPLIETRIANLKKLSYGMKAKPKTNELDDFAKADISTSVLKNFQETSGFKSKNDTALHWNEVCGSCFYMAWWDPSKGKKVAEIEKVEIGEDGIEKREVEGIFQGDVDYCTLTAYEVFPDNIALRGIEGQRSIIVEQVMKVEEIRDLYGIDVEGSEITTFALTPISSGGGYGYENTVTSYGHKTVSDSEKVITYFERPSKHLPCGRMIIVVGKEHLVYYGDLPYSRIPIVPMVCIEVAGQFYGKSPIESLIPYQKEYNSCKNRLHEYTKRVCIGNLAVEEGSIDIDEYEENGLEPGAILAYKAGYNRPDFIENASLPNEIMQEMYNLRSDMEYVAGVSQLMVIGATPSGVTSGTAIENLREIDNTRLSLTGDHVRNAVKELGELILEIYKKYAKTPRILSYAGSNDIAKVLTWCNEDIESTDVEFVTENELLYSEDAQKQKFMEAYQMGLYTDDNGRIGERVKIKALDSMKLSRYDDLLSINQLHLQKAQRENAFFAEGILPKISDIDNHRVHIEEHERFMLQMNYELIKKKQPALSQAFEEHFKEHKRIIAEKEMQAQMAMQQAMMQNGQN